MSDASRLIYIPRPDATPEGELNSLASIYAFVLKCGQERRKAGDRNAGDGMKGLEHDHPAQRILPR